MNVAFLGLGVMGYPMAGHLAGKDYKVCVYNRTTARAENWVEHYGGSLALTPAEAVDGADFVFACVGNDDDVRSITTGSNGAFASMKPASVFIDHTTASANVARATKASASAGRECFGSRAGSSDPRSSFAFGRALSALAAE